jgi:hypothetical protein
MLDNIKQYFTRETSFYTGLFAFLAISGWILNGWRGTHFILNDLMQIYAWIIGQITIRHGIDSKYNSAEGEKP